MPDFEDGDARENKSSENNINKNTETPKLKYKAVKQ